MQRIKRMTLIVVAAFVIGCVIGGTFVQWRMSHRESRVADELMTSEQRQPAANQPRAAAPDVRSTPSRSVIINGVRLNDQDIETLTRTFQVEVRDGNYWYDRMNG
jgi:hypothetical protein